MAAGVMSQPMLIWIPLAIEFSCRLLTAMCIGRAASYRHWLKGAGALSWENVHWVKVCQLGLALDILHDKWGI